MPTSLFLSAALALPALRLIAPPASAEPLAVDARFALALYCNPICTESVFDGLEHDLSAIPAVDGFAEVAVSAGRLMGLADTTASPYADDAGFAVPDQPFIDAYGQGVDRTEELFESQAVILVWFSSPRQHALTTWTTAHMAFANAAKSANGWVEDLDTQTLYGQATWAAKQPGGPLTDWFVVENSEASAAGEVRMVTRGLRRFGGRELVMVHVPTDSAGDAARVLNAVASSLHGAADSGMLEQAADDGCAWSIEVNTGEARGNACLADTPAIAGDPEPPLVAVLFKGQIFSDASLGGPPEAQVAGAASVASPAPTGTPAPAGIEVPAARLPPADPPRSLAEAQDAMRSRLSSAVRAALGAGLASGEAIAVSVPFPASDGGREYLWVDLQRWDGSVLGGVVITQPSKARSVSKGQTVTFDQAEVFDYVWKHADGTREGNTTAPFLR